jgi:hypothetical protein
MKTIQANQNAKETTSQAKSDDSIDVWFSFEIYVALSISFALFSLVRFGITFMK